MIRCLSGACAGVLMLSAAGCLDSFLGRQVVVAGPKITVTGSVDEVFAKLRDGLNDAEYLQYKREGAGYRIVSRWKSGTVYCLHLTPAKASGGGKTLVRMQWDRGGNDELWKHICKVLASAGEAEGQPLTPTVSAP